MNRQALYLLFSAGVSVSVLAYLFSHISFAEVVQLFLNADTRGLLLFLVLSLNMSVFRTWRYRLMLTVSGYAPSSAALFLVVLVRNFFSDLLPARLGTLVYVYILNSRLGVPFSIATASFALAFLFDIVAIAPLAVLAVAFTTLPEDLSLPAILLVTVILTLFCMAAIVMLPRFLSTFAVQLKRLQFMSEGVRLRASETTLKIACDIETMRAAGIYSRVMVLSVLVRLCKYGGLYFFLYALVAPLGFHYSDLPVPKVFIGLCVPELVASLPISGIGGFGAYEGAWMYIFQLIGFPEKIAQVTSISHHLFTQLYGYSIGILALLLLLLPSIVKNPLRAIPAATVEPPYYFFGKLTLFIASIATLLCVIMAIPLR